jgi:glycosyltransferase involved in cell wall biosynthesis
MRISVVVLTCENARTIGACLRSLAAQRLAPHEILVVDDASTDGTLDVVEEVRSGTGLPLRVLENGARNISRGRNIGLARAETPLVAFLDSDATADPEWTAALHAAFEADPRVAVVGGTVVAAHASLFAAAVAANDDTVRRLATHGSLLIGGCNLAVHRDLLDGEEFDERWRYAEDIEFVRRISGRHRWRVAPDAVVHHESRTGPAAYFRQMYGYGLWKVRYTRCTGHVRAVDYVPTAVLLGSAALGAVSPWFLLIYPAMSVAETLVVAAYRRPPARLLAGMLTGWLVKNAGWGLGVLTALIQMAAGHPGPAPWPPAHAPAPDQPHTTG